MLFVNKILCAFLLSCFEADQPISESDGCPSKCNCYSAPTIEVSNIQVPQYKWENKSVSVICDSKDLTHNIFNSFNSINTLALGIENKGIKKVTLKGLNARFKLTHLYLEGTVDNKGNLPALEDITALKGYSAYDLKFLTFINLELNTFDWNSLVKKSDLMSLSGIYIKDSNLTNLTNNFGDYLSQIKMTMVSIVNSNLENIDINAFEDWSVLRMLTITDSLLGDMKWALQPLPRLWFLDLHNNRIESIPDNLMDYLPNLKELNLNHNKIKSLSMPLVSPMLSQLRTFMLFDNVLCFDQSVIELFSTYSQVQHLPQFFDEMMNKVLCQPMPATDEELNNLDNLMKDSQPCKQYITQNIPAKYVERCNSWKGYYIET